MDKEQFFRCLEQNQEDIWEVALFPSTNTVKFDFITKPDKSFSIPFKEWKEILDHMEKVKVYAGFSMRVVNKAQVVLFYSVPNF